MGVQVQMQAINESCDMKMFITGKGGRNLLLHLR